MTFQRTEVRWFLVNLLTSITHGAQLFRKFRKWVGNKVCVGEIFRFLRKVGENGKGGPLGEVEDIEDFEDLGGGEWSRTFPFSSIVSQIGFYKGLRL